VRKCVNGVVSNYEEVVVVYRLLDILEGRM
jgi:hypothetical protein